MSFLNYKLLIRVTVINYAMTENQKEKKDFIGLRTSFIKFFQLADLAIQKLTRR